MNKKKLDVFFFKLASNLLPSLRGGGGKVIHISEDFTHLRTKLPLSWRTINFVGTIFGGSMYASTDPFFMMMLMKILGKEYVVWDKGCTIRFKRPAKKTLFADFHITPEMLDAVLEQVNSSGETTFTWNVAYKDKDNIVYAEFDKVLYVATKDFYKQKQKKRAEANISSA